MKFKIAFEVQNADDPAVTVVDKQQTFIELDLAALKGPDLGQAMHLTVDRLKENSREIDRSEETAAKHVNEVCAAAGIVISKFVEKALREWAKTYEEPKL